MSVLSAPHSCVRFGAISTEPLEWSSGAIELIYRPKRHWPALASPRLHLFSTAHVNSRRHIITAPRIAARPCMCTPKCPILRFSSNGRNFANFWQIPASELRVGTPAVLSGLRAGILVTFRPTVKRTPFDRGWTILYGPRHYLSEVLVIMAAVVLHQLVNLLWLDEEKERAVIK